MEQLININKNRDGSGERKASPAVLFLLLALVSVFCIRGSRITLAAVMQGGTATTVTMNVTCGYGETAKGDRYIPVRFYLENKSEQDFTGNLEVLTTESSREAYRYDYAVKIEGSSSLKEVYYIPLGVKADQLFVTLRGEDGSQILKKRVKLNISTDVAESLIGVLSDAPERLSHFDQIGVRYGTIRTRLVPLNQETLPEDPRGLDQLDLIIVSDYEFDRLSKAQQECIMQWTEAGGTLLFGGGTSFFNNLGSLAPGLMEGNYTEPFIAEVNLGEEYSRTAPQDSVMILECIDPELKNGSTLMEGNGFPILSYVHQKNGRIVTSAFALPDIAAFCQEHPGFGEKLYIKILGESKITELAQMDYYGFSNMYFSAQGLINTGDVDRLPNVLLYTVLMIMYVLLIGPVLYIVLKKKTLQRYYMGGVAVCALLFTIIIYTVGAKTRYRAPFLTYATILDTSEAGMQEQTFINVRSPLNKPYSIAIRPEYTVRPITKSYYYDTVTASEFTGDEGYKTALAESRDGTELRIRDTAAFTPKLFMLNKGVDMAAHTGIDASVSFFDGRVSGTVTNDFDFRLENAVLLFYGSAIILGDMEPGQQLSLDQYELLNYPLNYTYAFAQSVTGASRYEKADITDKTYMLAQERTRLLSFYMEQNMEEYAPGARLVAFSPDKNKQDFLPDESVVTSGLTMITSGIEVVTEQDNLLYRSALEKSPQVISGNYQERYNSMYAGEPSEPLVIEYSLGNNLDLVTLKFEELSPIFQENSKYPYLAAFKGKMYFYNYNTGHNDLMEADKKTFEAWELEPYLSPSNTITIKFVNEETGEYGWDRLLPMIYAIGRKK